MSVLGQHTAGPSFDGYFYQLQLALRTLATLDFGRTLGIEVLDDLHTEDEQGNIVLIQSKFHGTPTEVTDLCVDLWKTLGIWSQAILSGEIDLSRTTFDLLTTASLKANSVCDAWTNGASPKDIESRLLKVALKSKSQELAPYILAFRTLSSPDRLDLIDRTRIQPNQPGFMDLDMELRRTLVRGGFRSTTLDDAVEQLCGWLYTQIKNRRHTGWVLRYEDFHYALATVRDRMKPGTLTLQWGSYVPPTEELAKQNGKTYVQQLSSVKASETLKAHAILAYLRASEERNHWTKVGEMMPEELQQYDEEIFRRWESAFTNAVEDVSGSASSEEKAAFGLKFYRALYPTFDLPIRGYALQYVAQGSLHLLADLPTIGWHPEWEQRFKKGSSK